MVTQSADLFTVVKYSIGNIKHLAIFLVLNSHVLHPLDNLIRPTFLDS